MRFPLTRRKNHAAIHEAMDPLKEHVVIFKQLLLREFPMEFLVAAEMAQVRTFTFPRGTRLLHATGEFEKHSLKRLDDTRAILYELGRDTFYSERAAQMAAHLNRIHGFYKIPNEEFIYTLGTFIYDLRSFINRHGWRRLTRNEELAIYYSYRRMGELMNIRDLPDSFDSFLTWKKAYERDNEGFAESNRQVTLGLLQGLKEMVPWALRPLVVPFTLSLNERHVVELVGLRYPLWPVRAFFQGLMRLRRFVNRHVTLWDVLDFEATFFSAYKSYPDGYEPLRLGPEKLVARMANDAPMDEEQ